MLARTAFLDGRDYTPIGYNATTGTPPRITREQALHRYSLFTPAWACACVILGIQLVARVGAFLVLRRKFRKVLLTQQDAEAGPSCLDRLRRRWKRHLAPQPAAAGVRGVEVTAAAAEMASAV